MARGSCDVAEDEEAAIADARDDNAGELGLRRHFARHRLVLRTVIHEIVKFEILRHVPMIMETGLISKENDSGIRGL